MSALHVLSLSAEFAEAGNWSAEHASEIVHLIVADVIKGIIIATVGGYVGHKLADRRTRKAILQGDFEDDHAVFGDTSFYPSGEMRPESDQEWVNLTMRTFGNIELEKIFEGKHKIALMEYILKASKFCSAENPVVFSHLDKVIKDPVELESTKRAISQYWVNYFSSLMGGNFERVKNPQQDRHVPVERPLIPVLTMEYDSSVKKFRIFLLDMEQLASLPDPDNVRVEVDDQFVRDPDHHYMQRLRSYILIREILESDEGKWIPKYTTVREPTGEMRMIPPPAKPQGISEAAPA